MKRALSFAACIVAATTIPVGAQSEPTENTLTVPTTAALAELCADTSSSNAMMTTAAQNFCRGYLLGAYHILAQINATHGKPAFCIPNPSPTRNQEIAEFVAWARRTLPGPAFRRLMECMSFSLSAFPAWATRNCVGSLRL